MKEKKGITLIALVITIIVLLILAGVGLNAIAGENGILTNARNAKLKSEIADEKEFLALAVNDIILAKGINNDNSAISEEELQEKMQDRAEVETQGEELLVIYESGRKYSVNTSGEIADMTIEKVTDTTPGYIDGEGTMQKPYVIASIEDLVAFSYFVNDLHDTYEGEYVILERSLDFNSDLSYINPNVVGEIKYEDTLTVIPFNDLNGNGVNETLKVELTTGKGFVPIGTGENVEPETGFSRQLSGFAGIFDGKNNRIENININRPENQYVGLFGYNTTLIQNLTVSGTIIGGNFVGAIAGENKNYALKGSTKVVTELELNFEEGAYIRNCVNKANVVGNMYVGGIVGHSSVSDWERNSETATIEKCVNNGRVVLSNPSSTGYVGGIIGYNGTLDYPDYAPSSWIDVTECTNYGEILIENPQSNSIYVGGIAGANIGATHHTTRILNCINRAEILNELECEIYIGGIAGKTRASKDSGNGNEDTVIQDCENHAMIGSYNISGGIVGTASGGSRFNTYLNIINCKNYAEIYGEYYAGGIVRRSIF